MRITCARGYGSVADPSACRIWWSRTPPTRSPTTSRITMCRSRCRPCHRCVLYTYSNHGYSVQRVVWMKLREATAFMLVYLAVSSFATIEGSVCFLLDNQVSNTIGEIKQNSTEFISKNIEAHFTRFLLQSHLLRGHVVVVAALARVHCHFHNINSFPVLFRVGCR